MYGHVYGGFGGQEETQGAENGRTRSFDGSRFVVTCTVHPSALAAWRRCRDYFVDFGTVEGVWERLVSIFLTSKGAQR